MPVQRLKPAPGITTPPKRSGIVTPPKSVQSEKIMELQEFIDTDYAASQERAAKQRHG